MEIVILGPVLIDTTRSGRITDGFDAATQLTGGARPRISVQRHDGIVGLGRSNRRGLHRFDSQPAEDKTQEADVLLPVRCRHARTYEREHGSPHQLARRQRAVHLEFTVYLDQRGRYLMSIDVAPYASLCLAERGLTEA